MENNIHIKYLTENILDVISEECKPRLIKHSLNKTTNNYILTNLETNLSSIVKIPNNSPLTEKHIKELFNGIKAYSNVEPITKDGPINVKNIFNSINENNEIIIWIPQNALEKIKESLIYSTNNKNVNKDEINKLREQFNKSLEEHYKSINVLIEMEEQLENMEKLEDTNNLD